MSRSRKKGPYIHESLRKKVLVMMRSGDRRVIKTWSRASTIFPQMVGMTIGVHNGIVVNDALRINAGSAPPGR